MAIQGAALLGFAARFGMRALQFGLRHGAGISFGARGGNASASVRFGPVNARATRTRGGYRYRVGASADPVQLVHGAARVGYNRRRGNRGHPRRGQRR